MIRLPRIPASAAIADAIGLAVLILAGLTAGGFLGLMVAYAGGTL